MSSSSERPINYNRGAVPLASLFEDNPAGFAVTLPGGGAYADWNTGAINVEGQQDMVRAIPATSPPSADGGFISVAVPRRQNSDIYEIDANFSVLGFPAGATFVDARISIGRAGSPGTPVPALGTRLTVATGVGPGSISGALRLSPGDQVRLSFAVDGGGGDLDLTHADLTVGLKPQYNLNPVG